MQGSTSSEMLMCGGGVRSILLLLLVARCIETIHVCIWRMFVFMSDPSLPQQWEPDYYTLCFILLYCSLTKVHLYVYYFTC